LERTVTRGKGVKLNNNGPREITVRFQNTLLTGAWEKRGGGWGLKKRRETHKEKKGGSFWMEKKSTRKLEHKGEGGGRPAGGWKAVQSKKKKGSQKGGVGRGGGVTKGGLGKSTKTMIVFGEGGIEKRGMVLWGAGGVGLGCH